MVIYSHYSIRISKHSNNSVIMIYAYYWLTKLYILQQTAQHNATANENLF